jgi:hypothetical protein
MVGLGEPTLSQLLGTLTLRTVIPSADAHGLPAPLRAPAADLDRQRGLANRSHSGRRWSLID